MAGDNYTLASRFLHRLALSTQLMRESLFDLESSLFDKHIPTTADHRHVFVTGLARAGTTVLMRSLYESQEFASLTYADMPFVLCPNLWSKIARVETKSNALKERAHGDGIMVNELSPEALDEVFWITFCSKDFIEKSVLKPHEPSEDSLDMYSDYIQRILLRYQKSRYLCKNNNNILRLTSLAKRFKDSKFLVSVRHPLNHAYSLWNQHQRFLKADSFTREYMKWLGHFEFGTTHRSFQFGKENTEDNLHPGDLDYWLRLWLNTYTYVFAQASGFDNIKFIAYEDLCSNPQSWPTLCKWLNLNTKTQPHFNLKNHPVDLNHSASLLKIAEELYREITREGFFTSKMV